VSMGDWDDHEANVGPGRDSTRYTKCRYCSQRLPLREIAEHARTKHPVESLRFTNCWHCKEKFPLNAIREHASVCAGKGTAA
jgi:flavoprotein